MFFIPLFIPLIQTLGITILQARNQMKFRSLTYIVIALSSLALSILLAKSYGGYGCAFATGIALLLGQGVIMNIYYQRSQHLDIMKFWREIVKMSIVPICLVFVGLLVTSSPFFAKVSLIKFVGVGILFSVCYAIAFWLLSMNNEERDLFVKPLLVLKNKF